MVRWKRFGKASPALLSCLLLFSGHAFGQIYKWTDAQGAVHFSDKRPSSQASEEVSSQTDSLSVVEHGATGGNNAGSGATNARPSYAARQPKVIIYSTAWCPYCNKAKAYFRAHGIRYTNYDIEKNPAAAAQYKRLNGHGVPLIFVGKARLNGFSAQNFEQLYKAQ